jgi:hypothetical protein
MVFSDAEWIRFVEEYLDKPVITLLKKQEKYTTIIFTILFLMMDISRTST